MKVYVSFKRVRIGAMLGQVVTPLSPSYPLTSYIIINMNH